MSKTELNEVLSRFFGDVFDNLKRGTADRIIKQIKSQKFPPEVIKKIEKLQKDRDDLAQSIQKYNKKAKRLGVDSIKENKKK